MKAALNKCPFPTAVALGVPNTCHELVNQAASILTPLADQDYLFWEVHRVVVSGQPVQIPKRVHFLSVIEADTNNRGELDLLVQCFFTRSTDGYVRQRALRAIVRGSMPWVVPFVVLLAGEYVVEIADDLVTSLETIERAAYSNFVRENRQLMRLLRSRATSYWDCYYRHRFPQRNTYPGLIFLHRLEEWAN